MHVQLLVHTFSKPKEKKYIRNMHTVACTRVLGPGVPEKVDEHWNRLKQPAGRLEHVAGGGKTWPDGQKVWLGIETRSWGLANVHNRANKWKKM
jgi:hypothetical protein